MQTLSAQTPVPVGGAVPGNLLLGGPIVRLTGFVVVELKSGKFKPEHVGQLNFHAAGVNDLVKFPGMAPNAGILVCRSKHEPTVRYALDGSFQPIAVTSYTYETLPADERATLPSPPAITAALEQGTVGDADN